MLTDDRLDTVVRYRNRYAEFGYDERTLGWSKGRQDVRFQAALEGLVPGARSVLDVGCGFGDLFAFLRRGGWQGRYLGIDIVPELIEEGRRRYGQHGAEFQCLDLTADSLGETLEIAVAIGPFNHRLRQDNLTFVSDMLDALWRHTTVAVAADFLSVTADVRRDDLYYADPRDVLALAFARSRRVSLHHGYMPFEFNVKVWHDDSFAVEAPVFAPYLPLVRPARAANPGGPSHGGPA